MNKIELEKIDLKKFEENLNKIDASLIVSKVELIATIYKLYAINISEERIKLWAMKSPAYYPTIVKDTINARFIS